MKTLGVALSGSGFKFPCHVGALSALQKYGYNIVELSGTSGGAMVAALLASGISVEELIEIVYDLDTSNFMRFNLSALFKLGYSSGHNIEKELKHYLGDKTFNDVKIPLTIVATNVNNGEEFIFDSVKTPDFPLWLAVRASISIPIVLTPVRNLGEYGLRQDLMLVDGGLVNNMPIAHLVSPTDEKIGIHLTNGIRDIPVPRLFSQLAVRVIDIMLDMQEWLQVQLNDKEGDNMHTIKVNTDNLLDFNRELTQAEKSSLFNSGHLAVSDYFASLKP